MFFIQNVNLNGELLSLEWRLSYFESFYSALKQGRNQMFRRFHMFFIQNVNLNGEATLTLVIGVLILGYFIIMKK